MIRVRRATISDAETLARFSLAMAWESERKRLDEATILAGVRTAVLDPTRALYFVAELDGAVAGQTMVTPEWSDWRNAFFWWIQSVYVDPPSRRRGLFRALHAHVRDEAGRRSDVCGLRLYVHAENRSAMQTYDCVGMARTAYLVLEEDWSGKPK